MTETEIRAAQNRMNRHVLNAMLRADSKKDIDDRFDAEFEALRRECDNKHYAIRRRRDLEIAKVEMSFQNADRIIEESYSCDRRQPAGLLTA